MTAEILRPDFKGRPRPILTPEERKQWHDQAMQTAWDRALREIDRPCDTESAAGPEGGAG